MDHSSILWISKLGHGLIWCVSNWCLHNGPFWLGKFHGYHVNISHTVFYQGPSFISVHLNFIHTWSFQRLGKGFATGPLQPHKAAINHTDRAIKAITNVCLLIPLISERGSLKSKSLRTVCHSSLGYSCGVLLKFCEDNVRTSSTGSH